MQKVGRGLSVLARLSNYMSFEKKYYLMHLLNHNLDTAIKI